MVAETGPAAVAVAAHVIFGAAGNAAPYQLEGWSVPEPGFTWSVDTFSRTRIPYKRGEGTLVLELTVAPVISRAVTLAQRLTVAVNGRVVGDERVTGEATLGFTVPRGVLNGAGSLVVTLSHPDAVVPAEIGLNSDARRLGFSVRDMLLLWVPHEKTYAPRHRAPLAMQAAGGQDAAVRFCTALSTVDLMGHFESLGHSREFGLLQRAVGAEPAGLLRFANLTPLALLRGLDMAFEGIDDKSGLRVFAKGGSRGAEYFVADDLYGVQFSSGHFEGKIMPDALAAGFAQTLASLRLQFQDVLETGARIFVLHHRAAHTIAQVLPVLNLLRSHGPNVLLYVTQDASVPAGTVTQEKADLFHGYIDHLAHADNEQPVNVPAWVSICANAYRMWREQGGGV